jgi:Protein of unknown function (DUF3034)
VKNLLEDRLWLFALALSLVTMQPQKTFAFEGSRLLATGGVTQLEGAGGGGIVPWALIAGYGSRDEVGVAAYYTSTNPTDFTLNSTGLAVGIFDRVELSIAQQRLGLGTTVPGEVIRQQIFGVKIKALGDAIYAQDSLFPQIAVGIQHKRNQDYDFIPKALGAKSANGTDIYVAATKLYLGAVFGRNLLLNGTVRATKANQLGLLGFGGDKNDTYSVKFEGSAGIFLHDRLMLGAEYRSKPNNLSIFREDAFKDVFLAWLPNKHIAATLAYALLGNIADKQDQKAVYLSLQTGF